MDEPDRTPATGHLLLGIDTGGTFTDAVLYDDGERRVVASAKSPTTHADLAIGIRGAIEQVLEGHDPAGIELVSLSTTLATNALVEGTGRPVAAIVIGFDEAVVGRGGLGEALAGDPAIIVGGGHDSHGSEITPLDVDLLAQEIARVAPDVDAFAVMAHFGVRNPAHELAAAALVRELTGMPVTCSHTLSARLDGPRRAVTAVLNARLVPIVDSLLRTTEATLAALGIDAPVTVVRGDGSLVSSAFVRDRPIETILSGPAASIVGAAHLSGLADAVVSDVGGTTTDVAVLRDGHPIVSASGASVGGHHTMVTAVAMHTHGLGGDSEVRHDERAAGRHLVLGPRRVVPVGLLALTEPALVHGTLDRQATAPHPSDLHGLFVVPRGATHAHAPRSRAEAQVLDALGGSPAAAEDVAATSVARRALERLTTAGFVRLAGFTPTDACHVLGTQSTFDATAAVKAAALFARRRDRFGRPIAASAEELAGAVVDALVRRSGDVVLGAAFEQDGLPASTATSRVVGSALERSASIVEVSVRLAVPIVALGASAGTYYPAVAARVGAELVVPEHAAVANAVGAVAGRVRIERSVTVTSPAPERFLVHPPGAEPVPALDLPSAIAEARRAATEAAVADATAAGAAQVELAEQWADRTVDVGGRPMFVEGRMIVVATGRPALR